MLNSRRKQLCYGMTLLSRIIVETIAVRNWQRSFSLKISDGQISQVIVSAE
ncbi:Uncharacterised protein [Serratia marcescens]|nr:Uncharacterised protein [Serratia marcescens]